MENTGYVNVSLGLSPETGAALRVPPQYCENAPLVSAHYVSSKFQGYCGKLLRVIE